MNRVFELQRVPKKHLPRSEKESIRLPCYEAEKSDDRGQTRALRNVQNDIVQRVSRQYVERCPLRALQRVLGVDNVRIERTDVKLQIELVGHISTSLVRSGDDKEDLAALLRGAVDLYDRQRLVNEFAALSRTGPEASAEQRRRRDDLPCRNA